jgi:uncharacterized oxidoreductase
MPLISSDKLRQITIEIFRSSGAPPEESELVADHLVEANLRAVDSHGVIRIPQYIDDVRSGTIRPGASFEIETETPVSAVVRCGWTFGVVGALRAARLAAKKAKGSGMAVVVTKECNHAGRLGHYLELLAGEGLVAFGFCSSPMHGHFVVPWGGRDGRLSTNPISYGVPVTGALPIIADFSTSQAPEGKIRLYRNRQEDLPSGWIIDADGRPSTSPAAFYGPPQGGILPFGGRQGYRGYALGLLVEIMGSILSGQDSTIDRPGNGVSFMALNPDILIDQKIYASNVESMVAYIKSSRPVDEKKPILLPGEPELRARAARLEHGIEVESATWKRIVAVAQDLNVSSDMLVTKPTTRKKSTAMATEER